MVKRISINDFVQSARTIPVLDVRSPLEFQQGHIPGALMFPLFENEERVEIGTIFKHGGQLEAMKRGMELVGPKMGKMFELGLSHARDGKLLVHCWRGGKRSEAVAELLRVAGIKVSVLEGGYKRFRSWVLDEFRKDWSISVVGGPTGSGKTEVLHALARLNEPIMDLEQLADHKGSAFGSLGSAKTVSNMQFENEIAWIMSGIVGEDFWMEDESRKIGRLTMPMDLWSQKINSTIFWIDLPVKVRKERLMTEYGSFPVQELEQSIVSIGRRLGGQRCKETIEALHAGDAEKVLDILLPYYDQAYRHANLSHHTGRIVKFGCEEFNAEELAARFLVTKRQRKK